MQLLARLLRKLSIFTSPKDFLLEEGVTQQEGMLPEEYMAQEEAQDMAQEGGQDIAQEEDSLQEEHMAQEGDTLQKAMDEDMAGTLQEGKAAQRTLLEVSRSPHHKASRAAKATLAKPAVLLVQRLLRPLRPHSSLLTPKRSSRFHIFPLSRKRPWLVDPLHFVSLLIVRLCPPFFAYNSLLNVCVDSPKSIAIYSALC